MMTIVTYVALRPGEESRWDEAMHSRLNGARERSGWVAAQLVSPEGSPNQRAIIGTWESKDDWAAWHDDEAFLETRRQLEGLQEGPAESTWYEVVEDTDHG